MRGRFITLEGIDGAGKSTHLETLRHWLEAQGIDVLMTREPGGTPLAETLRGLVLKEPMSALSETLLMFAARHDHCQRRIEPALAAGRWVISDRFVDASFAYQGGGRSVPYDQLVELERWVVGALEPDLTFWFDLDPMLARQRLDQGRRGAGDRFEQEQQAFFAQVRDGYRRRFAAKPARLSLIDASRDAEAVRHQVETALALRFQAWNR